MITEALFSLGKILEECPCPTPGSFSATSLWVWVDLVWKMKKKTVSTVMTQTCNFILWVFSTIFPIERKAVSGSPSLVPRNIKVSNSKGPCSQSTWALCLFLLGSHWMWPLGFQYDVMPLGFCYAETSAFFLKSGPVPGAVSLLIRTELKIGHPEKFLKGIGAFCTGVIFNSLAKGLSLKLRFMNEI